MPAPASPRPRPPHPWPLRWDRDGSGDAPGPRRSGHRSFARFPDSPPADRAATSSAAVAITASSRAAAVQIRSRAGCSNASLRHRSSVCTVTPTSRETISGAALSGGSSRATTRSLNCLPYRATSTPHCRPRIISSYPGDNNSDAGGPRRRPPGPVSTNFPIVRGSAIDGPGWSAGDVRNRRRIIELEVVARDGIEPSTRGFSVRRRARFGAPKPKNVEGFPRARPNRLARPSPCRAIGAVG